MDADGMPLPHSFMWTTKEWVEAYREKQDVAAADPPVYQEIYAPLHYQRPAPKGRIVPDLQSDTFPALPIWNYTTDGYSPAAFAACIPEGRVFGRIGAVITPDQQLLADVSRDWVASPDQHAIFSQRSLPSPVVTAETVAVLDTVGGENYFHWMFDILPRLHLIRRSGWQVDKYILRNDGRPFQQETLKLLGIPADRIIRSHDTFHLQAKRLIVPSLPHESKWASDFLRDVFLPHAAKFQQVPKRIWVTRQQATYRRILNEKEVAQVLRRHGFQTFYLERLSVAEQVALFAGTDIIVAPHGAGLTNLAFCRPGTKVAELFSPRFFNISFWNLSSYADMDYHYLVGEIGQRPPAYETSDWYYTGLDDIRIDIRQLETLAAELTSHDDEKE